MTLSHRGLPAALVVVALIGAGCGGGGGKASLTWRQPPKLLVPPTLPGDRILTGRLRNASGRVLHLRTSDVRLVNQHGQRVPASAIFLQQYKHRLPPLNRNDPVTKREQQLSGIRADLKPGDTLPLTVSWHRPRDGQSPNRLELGGASVQIPTR